LLENISVFIILYWNKYAVLALWSKILLLGYITVAWNNSLCNLVIRQQRIIADGLHANSDSEDGVFLKKYSR
jgi:hypothetical protein